MNHHIQITAMMPKIMATVRRRAHLGQLGSTLGSMVAPGVLSAHLPYFLLSAFFSAAATLRSKIFFSLFSFTSEAGIGLRSRENQWRTGHHLFPHFLHRPPRSRETFTLRPHFECINSILFICPRLGEAWRTRPPLGTLTRSFENPHAVHPDGQHHLLSQGF